MGYAERILQPGETVAHRARLHWMLMAPGIVWTVVSGSLAIISAVEAPPDFRIGLLALSMALFLFGGGQLLAAWLRRLSTEIIVTNRRIILKTGLIGRRTIEMNLDKVESVLVNQGVAGRLFDFGTLVIRGVGSGLEPIANVAAPMEFNRYVNARG
jgi:uncharacterized membrane protein YdbT with pleckstrin-like domain